MVSWRAGLLVFEYKVPCTQPRVLTTVVKQETVDPHCINSQSLVKAFHVPRHYVPVLGG